MLNHINGKLFSVFLAGMVFGAVIIYFSARPSNKEFFSKEDGTTNYSTVDEMFAEIKLHLKAQRYQKAIDLLRFTNVDALISWDVNKVPPSIIVIDGITQVAPGVENHYNLGDRYNLLSFPETSDMITDPGFDFWILWAERFAANYNSKLEAALKEKKQSMEKNKRNK